MENGGVILLGLLCIGPIINSALFFFLGRWSKGLRLTRVQMDSGEVNPSVLKRRDAAQKRGGQIRRLPTKGGQ